MDNQAKTHFLCTRAGVQSGEMPPSLYPAADLRAPTQETLLDKITWYLMPSSHGALSWGDEPLNAPEVPHTLSIPHSTGV